MMLKYMFLLLFALNFDFNTASRKRKLDQLVLDDADIGRLSDYSEIRKRKLDQLVLDDADIGRLFDDSEIYSRRQPEPVKSLNPVTKYNACPSNSKYESLVQSYIQRYVNIFLRQTNFKDIDTSKMESGEFVYGTVNVRMRVSHLEELKKYYYEGGYISLPDLDAYFSGIFHESYTEHFKGYIHAFFAFLSNLMSWIFAAPLWQWASLSVIGYGITVISFLYTWYTRSWIHAFPILAVGLSGVEATQVYLSESKKAEIEQYLRIKRNNNIGSLCDPSSYTWFRTIHNLFFKDDCQQMLEDMQIPHNVHVSFQQCLMNTFLITYLKMPIVAIAGAAGEATTAIVGNHPLGWIIHAFISLIIFGLLCLVICLLLGAHLKGSNWLLGSVSLGFDNSKGVLRDAETRREAVKDFANKIYLKLVMPNIGPSCSSCNTVLIEAIEQKVPPSSTNKETDDGYLLINGQELKSSCSTAIDEKDSSSSSYKKTNANPVHQPKKLAKHVDKEQHKMKKKSVCTCHDLTKELEDNKENIECDVASANSLHKFCEKLLKSDKAGKKNVEPSEIDDDDCKFINAESANEWDSEVKEVPENAECKEPNCVHSPWRFDRKNDDTCVTSQSSSTCKNDIECERINAKRRRSASIEIIHDEGMGVVSCNDEQSKDSCHSVETISSNVTNTSDVDVPTELAYIKQGLRSLIDIPEFD